MLPLFIIIKCVAAVGPNFVFLFRIFKSTSKEKYSAAYMDKVQQGLEVL